MQIINGPTASPEISPTVSLHMLIRTTSRRPLLVACQLFSPNKPFPLLYVRNTVRCVSSKAHSRPRHRKARHSEKTPLNQSWRGSDGDTSRQDDGVLDAARQELEINLNRYRSAIFLQDADAAFNIYGDIKSSLSSHDICLLVNLLRTKCGPEIVKEEKDRWCLYAHEIARDLRKGTCTVDSAILTGLLALFKDTGRLQVGVRLWNWSLINHGSVLGPKAYGAAIELLLEDGADLESLEILFQRALEGNPGEFAAYHLSPNAQLPDRTQLFRAKGVSMKLLGAICLARIHHGDIRNAYLALDTALRIHPTGLPISFLSPFIGKRSVTEAYIVFQIACRCGISPIFSLLHSLVKRLEEKAVHKGEQTVAGQLSLAVAMAQLDLQHAYAGVTPTLKSGSQFFRSLSHVMYTFFGQRSNYPAALQSAIAGSFDRILSLMELLKVAPTQGTLRIILSAAGKFRSEKLLAHIQSYLTTSGARFTESTIFYRVLLRTAGALQNQDLLKSSWRILLSTQGRQPTESDSYMNLATLLSASADAKMLPFFQSEFTKLQNTLSDDDKSYLAEKAVKPTKPERDSALAALESTTEDLTAVQQKVERICDTIVSPQSHDFKHLPFQMTLGRPRIYASDSELRKVYERMTTDSHLATAAVEEPSNMVPITSTGFRIDDLRYENWKTMNELLAEAESETPLAIEWRYPNVEEETRNALSGTELEQEIRRLRTPAKTKSHHTNPTNRSREDETLEILDS